MIRGTAMKRARIKGLLRNLMVVAGNSGVAGLLPKLRRFLTHDDASVRSHAEWAIERLVVAGFSPRSPLEKGTRAEARDYIRNGD